jgi:hypothetical protein
MSWSSKVRTPCRALIEDALSCCACGAVGDAATHVIRIVPKHGARGETKIADEFTVQSSEVLDKLLMPYNCGPNASGVAYASDKVQMCFALVTPLTFQTSMDRDSGE